MRLNLGCGRHKLPGYVNVDCEAKVYPDWVVDLCAPWPWGNSSVDEVRAEHLLEHLPVDGFMFFMRELHRVSKPGAKTRILLPHPRHDIFLNDPTHILPLMPASFFGFSSKHMAALERKDIYLTPFYKYLGVDFDLDTVQYWFDEGVDRDDPELEWKMKHLNNVVSMWGTTLTAVK